MAIDDNVIEGLQDDNESTKVYLFGTDVSKIPCFKNSFLTGIYAGFGCGIAAFLATSRPLQSTNVAVISFTLATYGYWFNCRLKWAKNDFDARQNQETFRDEIESARIRKETRMNNSNNSNSTGDFH